MSSLQRALEAIKQDLFISRTLISKVAADFSDAMVSGLPGQPSSLKMLRSFLTPPTGCETGAYLTLDLGGSTARAALVELTGNGRWQQRAKLSVPLLDSFSGVDYRSEQTSSLELFDFLATLVAKVASSARAHAHDLGFTFSFPSRQAQLCHAELIKWTKEFMTTGVVGKNVGELLAAALDRKQLKVRIKAIINDTVGTLLAAAYSDRHTDIGSVLGTGHNSCYIEPLEPTLNGPMIINIEAGNFDSLPFTSYDRNLDAASEDHGQQRLEKMVSGKYIGELTRIIYHDLVLRHIMLTRSDATILASPYCLSGEQMSVILNDSSPDLCVIKSWLFGLGISTSLPFEREAMQEIAAAVALRSARLAASTYLAIIRRMDPTLSHPHTIAVNGSVYEKMPGYAANLHSALRESLAAKSSQVSLTLVKNGSLTGAAIAAAVSTAQCTW